MPLDDRERALAELRLERELEKRKARANFLAFYMRMTRFVAPRHLQLLARLLQRMEEDVVDRAMIFLPPRHAKTTLASTLMPAWVMGRNPLTKAMLVTHTQKYSEKVGGRIRNLMRSPEWPFDVTLASDSQAKDRWATAQGGEFNAFGAMGGNQHGNAAEWLFMDDIVKGRKMAFSAHMRDEIWETYDTDYRSRLEGRAKQIMTFTRWHMDDPAGRLLPEDFDGRTGWYTDRVYGEKWYVLCLPAVAERDDDPLGRKPGEWLWPEERGDHILGGARRKGGYIWSALYQQRPSPEEGMLFKPEHIGRYDPGGLDLTSCQIYGASDYAVTPEGDSPDPDYTVHQVWAVDPSWNIYLLDMWRGRTLSDEWIWHFVRLVREHKPLRWFEENGQIIRAVGPLIRNMMQREEAWVDRVQLTSAVHKEQRAHVLLGLAAQGKMYLPDRTKVRGPLLTALDAFEKELLQFPTGRHDDTVDTATLFARGIDRVIQGRRQSRTGSYEGDTLEDMWARAEMEGQYGRR